MPYKDPAKNAECRRQYVLKHPDKIREIARRYANKNKEKLAEKQRNTPKHKKRDYWLNCEYGTGAADHSKKRLEIQNGLCDACGFPFGEETPRFDHNHETGKWRGMLHDKCNVMLGRVKDNTKHLRDLADYLDRWEREHNNGRIS